MLVGDLKKIIREVPDHPKPGINFYDLTTLFKNGGAFRTVIERLAERFRGDKLDVIVGIEARGFMLAAALAYEYELGIVPVFEAAMGCTKSWFLHNKIGFLVQSRLALPVCGCDAVG